MDGIYFLDIFMRFFNWLIISLLFVISNCNATSDNPDKLLDYDYKVKRIGNNLFEGNAKGSISIIIKTFRCYEYEEDNLYGYKLIKDKGLILKFPNGDACAVEQIFEKVNMDKILNPPKRGAKDFKYTG